LQDTGEMLLNGEDIIRRSPRTGQKRTKKSLRIKGKRNEWRR